MALAAQLALAFHLPTHRPDVRYSLRSPAVVMEKGREAEDVAALIQQNTVLYVLRDVLLVLVSLSFFGYFWSKSGQTIGMRAWRMQVRRLDGSLPGFWQSAWRSLCALLGLGNILVLVDIKNKRALQDYLSGCEVVTLSKEDNKKIYQALD